MLDGADVIKESCDPEKHLSVVHSLNLICCTDFANREMKQSILAGG
jgi:hypothetical protein